MSERSLADQLATMRGEYLPRLAQQLWDLEALLNQAREEDPSVLEKFRTEARRISGTAGTYGLDTVARLADQMSRVAAEALIRPEPEPTHYLDLRNLIYEARTCDVREPQVTRTRQWLSATSLLLVEDDLDIVRFVLMLCDRYHIRLHIAVSADEARQVVRKKKFDVAIIDLNLKRDEGYELATDLRMADPGLPIGFTSVDGSAQNRLRGLEAGGTLFIDKPITPELFIASVVRLRAAGNRVPMRVLILGTSAARALEVLLQKSGLTTRLLSEAPEVLKLLTTFRPHCLVIDEGLSWMRSFDAARVVRSDARFWELPILLLVDDVRPMTRRSALSAGIDGVLSRSGSVLSDLAEIVRVSAMRGAARMYV